MSLNLFVPLDVDFQMDPKIIAAEHAGESLYVRSLALSKRMLSDGRIDRTQLPSLCLGLPGRPAAIAARLVDVGLWDVTDTGWQITAWHKRNQSSSEVIGKADRKKASAVKANHERWHVGETAKPSDSCPLCHPTVIRTGSDSESTEAEVETKEEVEEEASSSSSSCNSTTARGQHPTAAAAQPEQDPVSAKVDECLDIAIRVRCMQRRGTLTDPDKWAEPIVRDLRLKHGATWREKFTLEPDSDPALIVATTLRYDASSCRIAAAQRRTEQLAVQGGAA